MISNISSIQQINQLLNKLGSVLEFNAALPVEVKVLKQTDPLRYLLQIGTQTMKTRSNSQLEVGARYWAELASNKDGGILVQHLQKMPKLFQDPLPFSFEFENMKKLLQSENASASVKEQLLQNLANAQSKEEFNFLTQMLLSVQHQTLSIPFRHHKHDAFLQLKKRSSRDKEKYVLDFYTVLHHLGELNGRLTLANKEVYLNIEVMYESSKYILEKFVDKLNISNISISKTEKAHMLFDLKNSLLDVKG